MTSSRAHTHGSDPGDIPNGDKLLLYRRYGELQSIEALNAGIVLCAPYPNPYHLLLSSLTSSFHCRGFIALNPLCIQRDDT